MIKPIEQKQIDDNSVGKLSTRPNAPSAMGGNGLDAAQLRARFDALAKLAIDKINELLAYLNGDELKDGTTAPSFASLIKFTGDDDVEYTLEGILDALQDGEFFPVDTEYTPDSNFPQSGKAVKEVYDRLQAFTTQYANAKFNEAFSLYESVSEDLESAEQRIEEVDLQSQQRTERAKQELVDYVGEALKDIDVDVTVDQTFSPSSPNAQSGTAVRDAIGAHNVNGTAHQDIRDILGTLRDRINAALNSDDTSLDQLKEIVAYIKSNKSLIDAITTSKVSVDAIADNLTTNDSKKVLSAKQGMVIKQEIKGVEEQIPLVLPYVFEWGKTDEIKVGDENSVAVKYFNRIPKPRTEEYEGDRFFGYFYTTNSHKHYHVSAVVTEVRDNIQPENAIKFEIVEVVQFIPTVDQTYQPTSTNPQSGEAVALAEQAAVDKAKEYTDGTISSAIEQKYDKIYSPTSTKAQSGKAVDEAIKAALADFSPDSGGSDSGTVEGKLYHHLINIKGMGYITSAKMDANRPSELNVSLLLLDNNPNAYTSIQSLETIDKKGLLASGHICDYDSVDTQFTVSSVDFGVSPNSEPYRRYIVLHCLHAQAASYAGGQSEAEIIVEYDIPTYDDVSFGIEKVSDTLRAIEVTSDLIDKVAQNAAGRVPKADRTYDPESTNSQSGQAVAEAVQQVEERANQKFSNAATAHKEGTLVAINDISPITHGVRVWDKENPDMPVLVYLSENKYDPSTSKFEQNVSVVVGDGFIRVIPQSFDGGAICTVCTFTAPTSGTYHFSCDFSHTGTVTSPLGRENEILFFIDGAYRELVKLTNGANTTYVLKNIPAGSVIRASFYPSVTSAEISTNYVATLSNIFIGESAGEVEVEAGGTVPSRHPGMAIIAKNTSTTLCVEYNRDINKAMDGLKTYMEQLLGVIENGTY